MSRTVVEEIGRIPGSPDVKTEIDYVSGPFGTRIPYPRVFKRDVTHVFTITIKTPDQGDFTAAIRNAIAAGLAAGGVAAWMATPGSAIPAFKAAFWVALTGSVGASISEFEWVGTGERQERGEWKGV